jgi:predicted DNA-binding protein
VCLIRYFGEFKMTVKAKLTIILKANDTVVAEIEDSSLWQEVLSAVNNGSKLNVSANVDNKQGTKLKAATDIPDVGGSAISGFAAELGVSQVVAKGACAPTNNSPYIHLDKHHWEALKKNTPERGAKSVGAVVLAATLLVLWKDKAGLGATTMKEVVSVLDTIGVPAKNPSRTINNCEWLQLRNGTIGLNPAQTSKAVAVAKAYCTKESPWG